MRDDVESYINSTYASDLSKREIISEIANSYINKLHGFPNTEEVLASSDHSILLSEWLSRISSNYETERRAVWATVVNTVKRLDAYNTFLDQISFQEKQFLDEDEITLFCNEKF